MVQHYWWPLKAAFIKKKSEYRHYLLDYFVGLMIKLVFFVAMLVAYPGLEPMENLTRVSAYVLWYFAAHILAKMGNVVIEEASLGTISQILTTRTSIYVQLAAQAIAEVVMSLIWITLFLAIGATLTPYWMPLVDLTLLQVTAAIGVVFVTLVALVGIGFLLFGLSIIFKQVGSITELLIFAMLFFSGFFIPLADLPGLLEALARASPLWWSFSLLDLTFRGHPLGFNLVAYAAVSVAWIMLGLGLASQTLKVAKARGTLTSY